MFHKEILDDIEFVIIDNHPDSKHGEAIRKLVKWIQEPVQYLPYTNHQSTTVKNKVFDLAETPYVLCVDSHVMIEPGALKRLIDFYDKNLDKGNLLHGPLIYDDTKNISTHFDFKEWSGYMWGRWGTDDRGSDPDNEPFEIPGNGCGLFSCRKKNWLAFNRNFRGFGGEEGYIHEKYRQHGYKVLCLPFLRWLHRFDRPNGIHYPNNLKERFRNYMIGFDELGISTKDLKEHFKNALTEEEIKEIQIESTKLISEQS